MNREPKARLSLPAAPPWLRSAAPALLGMIGLAVALGTQYSIGRDAGPFDARIGFVAAAVIFAVAWFVADRRPAGRTFELSRTWEWRAVILVVGIALLFRIHQFYHFPPGLWYDEAINGTDALEIMGHGNHLTVWRESNFGHSTIYFYLLIASFKLFGFTILAMRIVPVLAGLAAVAAFYFLARRLLGVVGALAATAMMAVSRYAVTFSRISWEASLVPLLEVMSVYFFVRALDTRRKRDWFMAGGSLAAGLYTYAAYRMVPFIMAFFVLYLAATQWRVFRRNFPGLVFYFVSFLIVVAPLGQFVVRHPHQFNARANAVSVFNQIDREDSYAPLRHNIFAVAKMMNVSGDPNARHNLPNEPMLDGISAALLILGMAVAACSFRDWRRGGLLGWYLLALVPSAITITVENPSAIRNIGIVPPMFLLIGLAIDTLNRALSASTWSRAAFASIVLVLGVSAGAINYHVLFDRQASAFSVYDSFQPVFTQTSKSVASHADRDRVYVAQLFTHPALTTLAHGKRYSLYSASADVIFPTGDQDVLLIADAQQFGALPTLERLYPHLTRRDFVDPFGKVYWSEVRIPAGDIDALHTITVTLHAGATADGAVIETPRAMPVNHDWTADDLGSSGPVTAVWEGYFWLGSRTALGAVEFSAPGSVAVELDGRSIGAGRGSVTAAMGPLPLGEHRLRLTATIERPGSTHLAVGDQLLGLYTTSVGAHGFQAVFHAGRDFAAPPVMIATFPFAAAADSLPDSQAIEYRGTFTATTAGDYGFALDGSAAAQLYVDDQLIVDNGGSHSSRRMEGTITLDPGTHNLMIQYTVVTVPDWSVFIKMPDDDWHLMDGHETSPPTEPYKIPVLATIAADPSWPGVDPASSIQSPSAVTLLADGTAVVASKSTLVFVSAAGKVLRTAALPDGVDVVDLATDAAGEIVVADHAGRALLILSAEGNVLRRIAGPFQAVNGVDVHGGDAYVASASGGVLYKVPLSGGTPETLAFSKGDAPVRAAQPSDIAIAADGTYFVTDFERKKIIISPDGVQASGVPGISGVGAQLPRLVLFGVLMLVSDPTSERIVAYDLHGRQRGAYSFPPKQFGTRPTGIAITPDGLLYVVDVNGQVLRLKVTVPPELAAELSR